MNLLGVTTRYGCPPSNMMDIADPYTAYCFDEACAYIVSKIENGEKPVFHTHYKSFRDLYKNIG